MATRGTELSRTLRDAIAGRVAGAQSVQALRATLRSVMAYALLDNEDGLYGTFAARRVGDSQNVLTLNATEHQFPDHRRAEVGARFSRIAEAERLGSDPADLAPGRVLAAPNKPGSRSGLFSPAFALPAGGQVMEHYRGPGEREGRRGLRLLKGVPILLVAAAVVGCGGGTTVDQVETKALASLGKEPPPDVQGTILDVDCPDYPNTIKLEGGTRLRCGAFNVDKSAHEPEEQIGELELTVGEEDDYLFRACTATASGRGPKC